MNLKTNIRSWFTTIVGTVIALIGMLGLYEIIPTSLIFTSVGQMMLIISGVFLIFSRW